MNVIVDELIIEEDRPEHIKKHKISIKEEMLYQDNFKEGKK